MFKLYLLLLGAALVLGLLWLRSRDRRLLHSLAGVAALLAVLFAYDQIRPRTVAEQMQDHTTAMAVAVKANDANALFRHVSDRFEMGRYNKSGLRLLADRVMSSGDLTEVIVWDFADPKVQETTASIDFKVKARGSQGERYFRCTTHYVKDPDGQWRLQSFTLYDGLNNQEVPLGY